MLDTDYNSKAPFLLARTSPHNKWNIVKKISNFFLHRTSLVVTCYTDRELNYKPTCAIIQENDLSSIPSGIDITPAVIRNEKEKQKVLVYLSNLTSKTIAIAPKSIIGKIQTAKMDDTILSPIKISNGGDCLSINLIGFYNTKIRAC